MFPRLPRILLSIALAGSLGLHWVVFQAVAWAGMVVTYSQDGTLREAISKTLDGKHPCRLCLAIAKGKRSEKKPESSRPVTKLEFVSKASLLDLLAPAKYPPADGEPPALLSLLRSPPTPPPRVLA